MFSILLSLFLIIPTILGFGLWSATIFGNKTKSFYLLLLYGIFSINLIWWGLAFVFPVNIWVESISIISGLYLLFYFEGYKIFFQFLRNVSKQFYAVLIIVLIIASFYPFILDHFGYYVPTINWLKNYGLVQGISNLDLLLGQMSVWHVFQAGFSSVSDVYLRINVVVLLVYIIYIFEKRNWIHLIFLPFLFLFVQSPSPDLPTMVFSLILVNEILNKNFNNFFFIPFSFYIFSIKPTMLWLPLFIILYQLFFDVKFKKQATIFAIFIFILFVFKNLYCFGYPFFPVQKLDFGLAWAPNPDVMQISAKTAIEKTFDLQYSYNLILQFSIGDYIKNWLFLKGIKGKIHVLFILFLVAFLFLTLAKKSRLIWLLFTSIMLKTLIVLVFSAQYRFFIEVFFVIFLVFTYRLSLSKYSKIFFYTTSFMVIFLLSYPKILQTHIPSFRLGNFMGGLQIKQWYKPSYYTLQQYTTHRIGNLKFNLVQDYPFSFDSALPAISPQFLKEYLDAGIFPQQNTGNLRDGFYWRKLKPAEYEQLKRIVDKINPKYYGK